MFNFNDEGNLEMKSEKKEIMNEMEDVNMDSINNNSMLSLEKSQFNTEIQLKEQTNVCDSESCNLIPDINADKVYEELAKAQKSFIASVDEESLGGTTKDSDILNEINMAKSSGAFVRMEYLTLICGDENTTKIFAKLLGRDGNRGEPAIVFVYTDGDSSPELKISREELMKLSMGNYGRKGGELDKDDVSHARILLRKIEGRILPYWEFDIKINFVDLLKILSKSISKLKIDREDELDIRKVYYCICKYVEKRKRHPNRCYLIRRGFYAFASEDMLEIASSVNSNIPTVVKILKQHNLLHLQKSSIGNQCEVKGVGSCYCVKMLVKYKEEDVEDFSGNPMDEL